MSLMDQTDHCDVHCGATQPMCTYLLYHDTIDAHVSVSPGEVEQVHPAESETQHQEAEVLLLSTQIQRGGDQEED